jgi:uncharacterized protein
MPDRTSRFLEIDVLRGFAVLGIFQINILYFGQPYDLYHFPILFGDYELLNALSWFYTSLFVEGSMYGLFSLLFGVSAMILLDPARLDESGVYTVDLYYRRMLWLIAFGGVHAYLLLSPMEVLFTYGVLGLFLFPLRNLSPQMLLVIGGFMAVKGAFQLDIISSAAASTFEQTGSSATAARIVADLNLFQSGYWSIFRDNLGVAYAWQTELLFEDQLFDAGGLMLIGMALYKLGLVTGQKSLRFYLLLMLAGYVGVFYLRWPLAISYFESGFSPYHFEDQPTEPVLLARLFLVMGHLGFLLSLARLNRVPWLLAGLARAGQMALTNYVGQTLFAVLLFYGFAGGMYGRLERHELLITALGFGLFQMIMSTLWLRHFRFGPVEWLWRSLVRLQRQPFAISRQGS